MNAFGEITDDEFVRYLQSLGVETYNLSFEWMLNDPEFAGVLKWIYNNLDHNNVLTAREEYRYNEIKKADALLSEEELEAELSLIQKRYPGIFVPGDKEAKEDIQLDIKFQEERLTLLEKQEAVVKDLIRQNDLIKQQLTQEVTQLNAAFQQCCEDENSTADECLTLSQEIEGLMDGVIHIVADNMEMYSNCKTDKELSRRFLCLCSLESYGQSSALLRSQLDLFVAKHLGHAPQAATAALQDAAAAARSLEDRLSNAAFGYIISKSNLSGEQAKLALVCNYDTVQSSGTLSLQLLAQEEEAVKQRAQAAIDRFVAARTELAVDTATSAALAIRQQISSSLNHLHSTWMRAFSLDRVLYCALRWSLSTLEHFLLLAADLRRHLLDDAGAVNHRMESMNEICSEHALSIQSVHTDDLLSQALCSILGVPVASDPSILVKAYNDLRAHIAVLERNVQDGFRDKEQAIVQFSECQTPLRDLVLRGWSARAAGRAGPALQHELRARLHAASCQVQGATTLFTAVKGGDKRNFRKLWQWFLTDSPRFLAAVRNYTY